jgi:hypothetical protein
MDKRKANGINNPKVGQKSQDGLTGDLRGQASRQKRKIYMKLLAKKIHENMYAHPQKPHHWDNQVFHPTTPSFPFRVTSGLSPNYTILSNSTIHT